MTKGLPKRRRVKMRPKGWTEERRAHQAALTRAQKPWSRATGPKTAAGKAVCAGNATKHGFRSPESQQRLRRVRHALALSALNIERVRAFLRAFSSHKGSFTRAR